MNASCNWVDLFKSVQFSSCAVNKPQVRRVFRRRRSRLCLLSGDTRPAAFLHVSLQPCRLVIVPESDSYITLLSSDSSGSRRCLKKWHKWVESTLRRDRKRATVSHFLVFLLSGTRVVIVPAGRITFPSRRRAVGKKLAGAWRDLAVPRRNWIFHSIRVTCSCRPRTSIPVVVTQAEQADRKHAVVWSSLACLSTGNETADTESCELSYNTTDFSRMSRMVLLLYFSTKAIQRVNATRPEMSS